MRHRLSGHYRNPYSQQRALSAPQDAQPYDNYESENVDNRVPGAMLDRDFPENVLITLSTITASELLSLGTYALVDKLSLEDKRKAIQKLVTATTPNAKKLEDAQKDYVDSVSSSTHAVALTPLLLTVLGAVTLFKNDNKDVGIPMIVGSLSSIGINYFIRSKFVK